MGTLWSQRAGNGQLKYSGRLLCLSDSHLVEKNPPHHYTMLFTPNSEPTIQISQPV